MPSKMVIDRQRSSVVVERAAQVFGPQAAERLTPLFAAGLEPGGEPPDLASPIALLGKALERSRRHMVATDVAHDVGRRSDVQLRQRRDEAFAALRDRLTEAREVLDAVYGPGGASAQAGIDKLPAQEPTGLLRQADDVLRELREPRPLAVEATPRIGVSLDRALMVEAIEAPRQALVDLLDAVNLEQRKLTLSFAAKTEAIAAYDTAFGQVSRVLESLFEAAGMPLVAERVRPSGRRAGRTATDVDRPGDPPDDTPAPDPPAAAAS